MSGIVRIGRGTSPVVLAFPHAGTGLPGDIEARLNDEGRALRDTDWHVDRLYDGLMPGATTVTAVTHRYAIDVNRDPSGTSLYPGQNTTGLVPLTDFDNNPIWRDEPGEADIGGRVEAFHRPYHEALSAEIARVREAHGVAILYDCHSIRSRCPYLFDGTLPDFNIGTNGGATCAPAIERAVASICAGAEGFTSVVNGRFRGGWTTRRYGKPETGVHAIQMELAQSAYLETETPPFAWDEAKAKRLRLHLGAILNALEELALSGALAGGKS